MSTYKFWLSEETDLTPGELSREPDCMVVAENFEDALPKAVKKLRELFYVAEKWSEYDTLLCQGPYEQWRTVKISAPPVSFIVHKTKFLTDSEAIVFFKEDALFTKETE